MKYYVLIKTDATNRPKNVVVSEAYLNDGLSIVNVSSEDFDSFKELINTNPNGKVKNIMYFTLDDEVMSIPDYKPLTLICVNGVPDKFYGNYASYQLRLFAEDICASDRYEVENLCGNNASCPKVEIDIDLTDGSKMHLTSIRITNVLL